MSRIIDFVGEEREGLQLMFSERCPGLAHVTGRKLGIVAVSGRNLGSDIYIRLDEAADGNNNEYFVLSSDGSLSNSSPLTEDEHYVVQVLFGKIGRTPLTEKLYIRCRGAEQPFYTGDSIGTVHYRIPSLITLGNGDLMAAVDARFGPSDAPDNLETAVSIYRTEAGIWDKRVLVNNFTDYPNIPTGNLMASASFIDSQLIRTVTGRIIMMVDAYPYGGGLMGGNSPAGNGLVTVDGEQYLALTDQAYEANINGVYCGMDQFHFYIDKKRRICNLSDKTPTSYSVNEEYQVVREGELLFCQQFGTTEMVPMSIFYERSLFHVFKSSYLWMRTSDDNGQNWSAPVILCDVKHSGEPFLGMGPGRGIQVKNGRYAGRILLSVYDNEEGERASAIYSDDNGATWKRGRRTCLGESGLGKTSEAQIVELPDGTLRIFCRTQFTPGYIGYSDSMDGGETWTDMVRDEELSYCGNNQISAINYSKTADGKSVVLISYAMTKGEAPAIRSQGVVRAGLITENPYGEGTERYHIAWGEPYLYQPGRHDYSCMTEMADGNIAIFHENLMDSHVAGENMVFRILSTKDFLL